MLNLQNLIMVRDFLRHLQTTNPDKFNYGYFSNNPNTGEEVPTGALLNSCNTCACVAGWTVALCGGDLTGPLKIQNAASELLGLPKQPEERDKIRNFLFYAGPYGPFGDASLNTGLPELPISQAIERLNYLITLAEKERESTNVPTN